MASNVATRDVALDEIAERLNNYGNAMDSLIAQANSTKANVDGMVTTYGPVVADIEADPAHTTPGTFANMQYVKEQALVALFATLQARATAIVAALTGK